MTPARLAGVFSRLPARRSPRTCICAADSRSAACSSTPPLPTADLLLPATAIAQFTPAALSCAIGSGAVARFNSGTSGTAFPTPRSQHHGAGFRPTQLGHPVEDVIPDRGISPLNLAVPRLQAASEQGLVSEEPVFNARLLSVARLLLPLSSPDLANPLKSRFTLRPWAVRWPSVLPTTFSKPP